MSRRGSGPRRDRPSPSQPTPPHAASRGRGRGLGAGRGAASGYTPPPVYAPPMSASSSTPPPALPVVSPSAVVSVSAAASSSSAPAAVESLSSEVEQQLTLQSPAPSSSKAIRFPDRPGYGVTGRKIKVRANHFKVDVVEKDLHHYDVRIAPEVTSKKVSRDVMSLLVQTNRETLLGNRIPAYDGRKGLFTAGPLPFESRDFVIKLSDDVDERGSSSGSNRKKREREFKVTIRFASKADIHHLNQYLRRLQLDCPQETIQALDVVLRASPSEKYNVVGRSFFSPSLGSTGPLGGGIEYWRGYYQSLRPTQMGLSLNIDVSARGFYEPIHVIEFIEKHFRFNLSRPLSDQDRIKVKKALRGIKVHFDNGQFLKSYKVAGVSREPLRELMFTLDDNRTRKSVVQYFREKYNVILEYLNLPAVQAGSDSKPVYLPMELCKIAPKQRYTKRLNEEQVTALLRATCQRPHDRESYIKETVVKHKFSDDTFVREFGMKVKEDLALVDARVLPPPKLNYHTSGRESIVDPRMGQWNMINKKMFNGGNVQYWTCLNFARRVNPDLPFAFCRELVNMCISKGMVFNQQPLIPISTQPPDQIEKALVEVHKQCMTRLASMKSNGRLQLLIIILPDFKGSYPTIKRICETELGIVSQCCQPRQAQKMNNKQYLENLSLKINVKVGGRNTVLNEAIQGRMAHVSDMPTLILGADVTHPQPGEDSSPSIAAVVASVDWPQVTKYRGIVSAQQHRQEIIQDLYKSSQDPNRGHVHGGMIREVLMAFYKTSNKCKPHRIIFYRDGVSEGQFSQVLLYEVDAIRKACASLEDNYQPRITFVVVQKRHHTRLFPVDRNQTDRSGNIMPGTVVDTSICHPREFDFYLNSHAGIQGTSRPTHYHVLYDENDFTADGLQTLTNNLCYTYARCTRSVSIVPPAYYAHLAAFRARYYIEGENSDGGSGGRNFEVALPAVMDNVKEVMFFC